MLNILCENFQIPSFGLSQALVSIIGLVIENNPGVAKLKIVEAGGNSSFEALLAPKLIEIVESEPTFNVSIVHMSPSVFLWRVILNFPLGLFTGRLCRRFVSS